MSQQKVKLSIRKLMPQADATVLGQPQLIWYRTEPISINRHNYGKIPSARVASPMRLILHPHFPNSHQGHYYCSHGKIASDRGERC